MDTPEQRAEVCIFPRLCDSADLELQLMCFVFFFFPCRSSRLGKF